MCVKTVKALDQDMCCPKGTVEKLPVDDSCHCEKVVLTPATPACPADSVPVVGQLLCKEESQKPAALTCPFGYEVDPTDATKCQKYIQIPATANCNAYSQPGYEVHMTCLHDVCSCKITKSVITTHVGCD